MNRIIIGLMWLALLVSGCGGSENASTDLAAGGSPSSSVSQVSFGTEGGRLRYGDLLVEFEANAVSAPVTVSGRVVTLTTIPSHIKPLSAVHKLNISDPQAYQPHKARLTFTLPQPNEGASVFHSDDGVNWLALGGDVQDSNVAANTPKFSYFFAGVPDPSSMPISVQIQNDSDTAGDFFIFRFNYEMRAVPLAMQTCYLTANGGKGLLTWSENYQFYWGSTSNSGLSPGAIVYTNQLESADLTTANQIELNSTGFDTPEMGPATNTFTIINNNIAYEYVEGIAVFGSPAYAATVLSHTRWTAGDPGQDRIYLAFGNKIERQSVLSAEDMANSVELPPGDNLSVIYTKAGTWEVQPNL